MLRSLALLAVLLVFVGVLYAAHAYLAVRLVFDAGLGEPWRSAAVAAIAALGLSLVLQPAAERFLPAQRMRWLAWPAALWMGFLFLAFNLLLASDLLLWFTGSPATAAVAGGSAPAAGGLRAAGVLLVALLLCGVALREGTKPPRLVREEYEIERWPRALDGFRIVQLSDVHIGPLLDRRFARHLVERVNALEPDLVVVTGDLVDGRADHLEEEVAPLADLRAKHGVYFVTGNHDHLSGAPSWVETVERLGMTALRNRHVAVGDADAGFDLIGVDDHRGGVIGGGGEDLDAALAGRDPERPGVLLAHDPTTFRRARREPVDLQLSGHTHGGQIWPFRYLVRLAVPWVDGRHREGRVQLYVSRGTGFWGPPMRLLAPAEITEHTLRAPVATALQRDSGNGTVARP
ncbi:MAG: metallophosphoesterase [Myxococcota bacterium]